MHSGIQERDGGVARFYRSDSATNAAVSTEITGYAASTLAYLHSRTGQQEYLDAAVRAARYLSRQAWDSDASTFPFEPGSDRAYFFDIGIIVRGLLAVWRATGEEEFRARAQEAALSLAFDFLGDGSFSSGDFAARQAASARGAPLVAETRMLSAEVGAGVARDRRSACARRCSMRRWSSRLRAMNDFFRKRAIARSSWIGCTPTATSWRRSCSRRTVRMRPAP